ncbi:restriction endonuclease subunit S [Helicobacter pylori]|uniref:restriction endonuclease subunit S n=1 Tax=Helicobacter pylori TaxID=210 RepID=UPI003467C678|nr:restriction endonuclease subunit S [Helicobacter pylori]WQX49215.1 restriction endonuclease subunit S [Helicobacter pylori]
MIGPLNSQLNAIKWGEFRLGDLFEKIIIKPLPYQTAQLPKEKTPTHELSALTAGILNQGLNNFVPKENATILKNVISISANGANTGATFYQPHEFCVLQDAYAIEFIGDKKLNDKKYLFFVCAISKVIYNNSKYEWTNKAGWNKVKNELISLPLKPTANAQTLEDIDFDFMEKFIAELEQCWLAELQAYLKATGLENTTLSNDEENALNVFNNSIGGNTPCGLTWQSFRLGDLFEVLPSKKIYHANTIKIHDTQIENSYPYVVRAATNNGIKGFIIDDPTFANEKNTLSFAQDTFTVFYQKQPYFTGNKVKILKPKFAFKSPKILHSISAILQFILKPLTWGLGSTTESIAEFKFSLPLKPTAKTQTLKDIDFNFMHTLINALMKQTIQGVAQYCDAKIQATKEAISQEAPIQKDSLF